MFSIEEKLFVLRLAFGYAVQGCTGCSVSSFKGEIEYCGAVYENAEAVVRAFQLIGIDISDVNAELNGKGRGPLISAGYRDFLECHPVEEVVKVVRALLEKGGKGE
ncbi:hypothetical protein HYV30_02335 [Candidatus Kaiserbacteria bacterium]|nr:hypothetical protein [Candidatus Kaiserbacteria bacterium]